MLLVSPEFIDSEFIFQDELPPLLTGADGKVIILVAIPISAAYYEAGGLSEFQFAHPPNEPLDKMRTPRRNAALVEIVKKIVAAAQSITPYGASPPSPAPTESPSHRSLRLVRSRCSTVFRDSGQIICGGRNISIS